MNKQITCRLSVMLTREPIELINTRSGWFTFKIGELGRQTLDAEPIRRNEITGDDNILTLIKTALDSKSVAGQYIYPTDDGGAVFPFNGKLYYSKNSGHEFVQCLLAGLKYITPAPGVMYVNATYPNSCIHDIVDVFSFDKFKKYKRTPTARILKAARSGEIEQDIGICQVSDLQVRTVIGFRKNTSRIALIDDLWVILFRNKDGHVKRYSLEWILQNLENVE